MHLYMYVHILYLYHCFFQNLRIHVKSLDTQGSEVIYRHHPFADGNGRMMGNLLQIQIRFQANKLAEFSKLKAPSVGFLVDSFGPRICPGVRLSIYKSARPIYKQKSTA